MCKVPEIWEKARGFIFSSISADVYLTKIVNFSLLSIILSIVRFLYCLARCQALFNICEAGGVRGSDFL